MRDHPETVAATRARARAVAESWLDGAAGAPADLLSVEHLGDGPTEPIPCFCAGTFCWTTAVRPE